MDARGSIDRPAMAKPFVSDDLGSSLVVTSRLAIVTSLEALNTDGARLSNSCLSDGAFRQIARDNATNGG
jgi:hypothetical protein